MNEGGCSDMVILPGSSLDPSSSLSQGDIQEEVSMRASRSGVPSRRHRLRQTETCNTVVGDIHKNKDRKDNEPTMLQGTFCVQATHFLTKIHDPRDTFRSSWDVIFICLLIYNLVEVPLRICYEIEPEPWGVWDIFNLLVDIFFLCDVALNFRTGFYEQGIYISDPKTIAKRYLRGWFILDFLSSIPLSHVMRLFSSSNNASASSRLPRLIRFARYSKVFRIVRVYKLGQMLGRWDDESGTAAFLFRAFKFTVVVYLISHLSACIWMGIVLIERHDDGQFDPDSWPSRIGYTHLSRANWDQLYLTAIYWSLSTIATVGFGDIHPLTELEIAFTVLLMFVGAIAFGYIVGHVSSLVAHEDETSRQIRQKSRQVKEYLIHTKLPPELRKAVLSHFEYQWSQMQFFNESHILKQLPPFLRTDVVFHLHNDVINSVPFLRQLGVECVGQLLPRMRPLTVPPDVYVFRQGQLGTDMYVVTEGLFDVVSGDDDESIAELGKGAYFGEFALLSKLPTRRTAGVRSRTMGKLLQLTKEDYEAVLTNFPEVYLDMLNKAASKWKSIEKTSNNAVEKEAVQCLHRIHTSSDHHTTKRIMEHNSVVGRRYSKQGHRSSFSSQGGRGIPGFTSPTSPKQRLSLSTSSTTRPLNVTRRSISTSAQGGKNTSKGSDDSDDSDISDPADEVLEVGRAFRKRQSSSNDKSEEEEAEEDEEEEYHMGKRDTSISVSHFASVSRRSTAQTAPIKFNDEGEVLKSACFPQRPSGEKTSTNPVRHTHSVPVGQDITRSSPPSSPSLSNSFRTNTLNKNGRVSFHGSGGVHLDSYIPPSTNKAKDLSFLSPVRPSVLASSTDEIESRITQKIDTVTDTLRDLHLMMKMMDERREAQGNAIANRFHKIEQIISKSPPSPSSLSPSPPRRSLPPL